MLSIGVHAVVCACMLMFFCLIGNGAIAQPNPTSAADCFPAEVVEDLTHQLKCYREQIQTNYAHFVSSIHDKLVDRREVSVSNLRFFLLNLPALACDDNKEHHKLLYGVKSEIYKATTIEDIFFLLTEYTSFLDYHIYLDIAVKYNINIEKEKSDYLDRLNDYVEKHKVSDLVSAIPTLCKFTDQFSDMSKTLVFKLNIQLSCKLANLITLKSALAKLLGFNPSALRLISIETGSVLVAFLIPAFAAEYIFHVDKGFTQHENEKFRALSVVWLEYDHRRFDFVEAVECGSKICESPDLIEDVDQARSRAIDDSHAQPGIKDAEHSYPQVADTDCTKLRIEASESKITKRTQSGIGGTQYATFHTPKADANTPSASGYGCVRHTFQWDGGGNEIFLVGSFNGWEKIPVNTPNGYAHACIMYS